LATVVCVLKGGGDFDYGHVARLAYQVRAHVPTGTKFVCLTDDDRTLEDDFGVRLKHDWPGWWSKAEIFKLRGPCLYLDLDVNVIGDLAPLLEATGRHDLILAKGFWGVDDPSHVNSSVMGWRGDLSAIYREFAASPEAFMSIYAEPVRWGDQAYIRDTYAGPITLWQEILSGMVLSYKRDALQDVPIRDCRVLCSHGLPRPWAPDGADAYLASKGLMSVRSGHDLSIPG